MSTDIPTPPADGTQTEREQQITAQLTNLLTNDPKFRAAAPSPAVQAAIERPELPLSLILTTLIKNYTDRPTLNQRTHKLTTDARTDRRTQRLLPRFKTLHYRKT